MKKEQLYEIVKPVIEYTILGIWYDLFMTYVTETAEPEVKSLQVIDSEIKKFIANYSENLFFAEQAKYDKIKQAFLVNAKDSSKAIKLLQ